jgi:16S rRNA (cytosine967-C5)-methyltransferase
LGEDFWPLVDSLQHTAGLDVRVNTLQAKRADVQAELEKNGIAVMPTPFSPWGLRMNAKPNLSKLTLFEKGVIEVQDEGSQLLALLLDAKRGEMVADFCAGAGGKTLALGAAMRNTGRLYAFDTSAHRLEAMKPRLARSGLSNIHPVAIAHERDDRIKRLRGKMDRVLVDAPCTGLGTLRRNPDLKWRQTPEAVAELTVKQAAILASAARLLKPGGRLVYATCSLLPAENEEIAQAFSAAHPNFKPLLVKDLLTDFEVSEPEDLCTPDGLYLRLWPHRHGTDGFFAAAWAAA